MTRTEQPHESATAQPVVIREALSPSDGRLVTAIRREVFSLEQRLTDVVDADDYDRGPEAVVLLAFLGELAAGTGRVHVWRTEGQIAWVAVRRQFRRQGVGWDLMDRLLSVAGERGARRVTLSAQTHALRFYQLLGFRTVGETYIMSDIEHITMIRDLHD